METLAGARFRITGNDSAVAVEEDGHLSLAMEPSSLTIQAYIPLIPGRKVVAVRVIDLPGRARAITLVSDVANLLPSPPSGMQVFRVSVPVVSVGKCKKHQKLATKYPENAIWILECRHSGEVDIWEVAIATQCREFFFTLQHTRKVQCFRDNKTLVCPELDDWAEMVHLLRTLLKCQVYTLPPISDYVPKPEISPDGFEPNIGRVLWYSEAQGFGAIQTHAGVASVHYLELRSRDGCRRLYLRPDETVYIKRVEPCDPAGEFIGEAKGVRALH